MLLEGHERGMGEDDFILSRTDLKGRPAYAHGTFLDIAGFSFSKVLDQSNSLTCSRGMLRGVFKLFRERISSDKEGGRL